MPAAPTRRQKCTHRPCRRRGAVDLRGQQVATGTRCCTDPGSGSRRRRCRRSGPAAPPRSSSNDSRIGTPEVVRPAPSKSAVDRGGSIRNSATSPGRASVPLAVAVRPSDRSSVGACARPARVSVRGRGAGEQGPQLERLEPPDLDGERPEAGGRADAEGSPSAVHRGPSAGEPAGSATTGTVAIGFGPGGSVGTGGRKRRVATARRPSCGTPGGGGRLPAPGRWR